MLKFIKIFVATIFRKRESSSHTNILLIAPVLYHACATPLTTLTLGIDYLENCQDLDRMRDTIDSLKRAITRIDYLLRYSVGDLPPPENFFVNEALIECAVLFNCHVEQVIFKESGNNCNQPVQLFGERVLFQEAIICLLNNAIEATRRSRIPTLVKMVIMVGANKNVRLDIIDRGRGDNRLVELYKSNHLPVLNEKRGKGIWVAKKILENYFKSKLQIVSDPTRGTRVSIRFSVV